MVYFTYLIGKQIMRLSSAVMEVYMTAAQIFAVIIFVGMAVILINAAVTAFLGLKLKFQKE